MNCYLLNKEDLGTIETYFSKELLRKLMAPDVIAIKIGYDHTMAGLMGVRIEGKRANIFFLYVFEECRRYGAASSALQYLRMMLYDLPIEEIVFDIGTEQESYPAFQALFSQALYDEYDVGEKNVSFSLKDVFEDERMQGMLNKEITGDIKTLSEISDKALIELNQYLTAGNIYQQIRREQYSPHYSVCFLESGQVEACVLANETENRDIILRFVFLKQQNRVQGLVKLFLFLYHQAVKEYSLDTRLYMCCTNEAAVKLAKMMAKDIKITENAEFVYEL